MVTHLSISAVNILICSTFISTQTIAFILFLVCRIPTYAIDAITYIITYKPRVGKTNTDTPIGKQTHACRNPKQNH